MHWSDKAFLVLKSEGFRFGVRPHVPNFVDTEQEPPCGVQTLSEVFTLPFITKWSDDHFLTISKYHGPQHLIVAFSKDRTRTEGFWWVIGYIADLNEYTHEAKTKE